MNTGPSGLVPRSRLVIGLLLASSVACSSEYRALPEANACAAPSAAGAANASTHDVLTQHNDNARTGAMLGETELNTCNVPGLTQLGRFAVDGEVYAQPLYAAAVTTALGSKNLLLVATMADSLYAFDADLPGSEPIWQLSQGELGSPSISTRNISGNNGILATPVIDRDSGMAFVVVRDCDAKYPPATPRCQQRLFAVELGTGKIVQGVNVQGNVPAEMGASATFFDPNTHWARAGLLLAQGQLYVSFGAGPNGNAHEEDFEFHGWLFRYNASDLTRNPGVLCTTPDFGGGAIWQSGNGPAADEQALYFATGNGIHQPTPLAPAGFPAQPEGYENGVVSVGLGTATIHAQALFVDTRPYHDDGNVFQYMEKNDIDLGTAGPLLIPESNALISAGKSGIVYVLDRGSLQSTQDPIEAFHAPPLAAGQSKYIYSYDGGPHVHGSPVFFRPKDEPGRASRGLIYFWPAHERLQSFGYDYQTGRVAAALSADVPELESGGTLAISADGGRADSAVLWASTVDADDGGGHLWALSATTLERLWDGKLPAWAKFAVPTVAAGRVYLASTSSKAGVEPALLVFGLPSAAAR